MGKFLRFLGAALLIVSAIGGPAISAWTWNVPYHPDQATGDLMYLNISGGQRVLTSLPAVATGKVLVSAGTGTAPTWSDAPTLTNITGTNGYLTGFRRWVEITTATTSTIDVATCGGVFIAAASTDVTTTYTLPAVTNGGCMLTFITGDQSGSNKELRFTAAEGTGTTCIITTFAAVGTDADTAIVTDTDCSTGIKNTHATAAIGDSCTIVSNGVDTWFSVGACNGIWASY